MNEGLRKMKIKRILKYLGISVAILILGFLAVAQIAYQSIPEIEPPGKMYSVNGGEIHMYCTGPNNEKPTIVIISGGGTASLEYFHLQEKLSQTVRTCSYDTAGIGWSHANDIPYTTKNMSDELYQLLQTAQIDGPIILAGHSVGGITSLIYSADHEEQVVGIAFIDSSHYDQTDYFGKEFKDTFDKEMKESLETFWLIELGNNLGILNLMGISNNPEPSMDEKYSEMRASLYRWNPPFSAIKSMISNIDLSSEQGKEAHYDRGDLPIIVISAAGPIAGDSREIGGVSIGEYRKGLNELHKDLAELSSNGKHAFVNGTSHTSIVYNDETAEHILSVVPEINDNYPINSTCDWFLVNQLEFQLPEPSQWYLDNFYEEYDALRTLMKDEQWWDDEDYQASALEKYHESLKKKIIPELYDFDWNMLEPGEEYFAEVMEKDPQCHEIVKTNYPGFDAFR